MRLLLAGLFIFSTLGIWAQEPPGLRYWDTRTALITLSRARVLTLREPGRQPKNIWIKTLDVYLMGEQRWGIKINGEIRDWRQLYITIAGREVNLALAFQYSEELDPNRMNPRFQAPDEIMDQP